MQGLTNDFDDSSKKSKVVWKILIGIFLILIIVLAVFVGYFLGENKNTINDTNKKDNLLEKNEVVQLDVNSAEVKDLFNNYNLYSNWLNIYKPEVVSYDYYKYNSKHLFSYFYDSNKIENVDNVMKFTISIGNLYMKEETQNNYGEIFKEKVLDINDGESIDFNTINNKSIELFGSGIEINDIVDNKNNVIVGVMSNVFKYDPQLNVIKTESDGIGDGSSIDYYTKILDAKKYEDEIVITNKVMFVVCTDKCYVSKNNQDINNIGSTLDEIDYQTTNEERQNLIDKYSDELYTYKWTFAKNTNGKYIFKSIQKIQ